MRILTDTNVILDIFLDREPFVDDARLIWKAHEEERLTAYVSAITPVNLFYIARKAAGTRDSYTGSSQVISNTSCDDGKPKCLGVSADVRV